MENNEIGQRIQELMFRLKLKQTPFAESIGVSQTAVNKIVNGLTKPRFVLLEAICDKYPQVNKEWLMSGKGEMFNTIPATQISPDSYLQEYLRKLEEKFEQLLEQKNSVISDQRFMIEMLKGQLGKPECVTETGVVERELPRTKELREEKVLAKAA